MAPPSLISLPRSGYTDLERSLPPSPATPSHPLSPASYETATPPRSPLHSPSSPLGREHDPLNPAGRLPSPTESMTSTSRRQLGGGGEAHGRSNSVSQRLGMGELAGPVLRTAATPAIAAAGPTASLLPPSPHRAAAPRDSMASQSSSVVAYHMANRRREDQDTTLVEGGAHSISFAPDLKASSREYLQPYSEREALMDDKIHDFTAEDWKAAGGKAEFRLTSLRGWLNMSAIVIIFATLVAVFAGYPIIDWATVRFDTKTLNSYNDALGGFLGNSSGQVPVIPGFRGLVDEATPESVNTRIGSDGKKYLLQFSDETLVCARMQFNTDGRTFWPGDDPYWEAVDIHYWPTGDLEWYDPSALVTRDGNLVITMTKERINDLDYKSGMLQSWNKFCFTGGYIEVNISLPGSGGVTGFWPGAWTLGNLARAGYGATTDSTWPYSYSSCDIGTLPNQTTVDGSGPPAAVKLVDDLPLSYQPGQRVSACTCPADESEHPGPSVDVGRGAPEIDIIEAQTFYTKKRLVGAVSQSAQFAPYDDQYQTRNETPYTTVHTPRRTVLNDYLGGIYQEAVSGITTTDQTAYRDTGGNFATYGFEYWPDRDDGYITWYASDEPAWTLTAGAVGPNARTRIGQRLISEEPMSIILNLGISQSFQHFDASKLDFPGEMLIDYVRVYQREGEENIGCDPPGMPTAKYIENHKKAYMDPLVTTWEQAGFSYPRNSLQGC